MTFRDSCGLLRTAIKQTDCNLKIKKTICFALCRNASHYANFLKWLLILPLHISVWRLYVEKSWIFHFMPLTVFINPLNAKLNPICHLLTLLGRHHILHVSRIRINIVLTYNTAFVLNCYNINPLNAELNPICYLLALLGAHHFLHVSRIRVKSLTLRLLMSYIYI